MTNLLEEFNKQQLSLLKKDLPFFKAGDSVEVSVIGSSKKQQVFKGICIRKRNRGIHSTFVVRRIAQGMAIERSFPIYSPVVTDITVSKRGIVRRAKLYYLRKLSGKAARIREDLSSIKKK